MCGIAGIVRLDGDLGRLEPDITAMTAALAHRGPDGSGIELLGPVAFGHQRLAILDREHGAQPMANETRTAWITYNGEIYNHRELRRELEGRGHRFRTSSDTEVIL